MQKDLLCKEDLLWSGLSFAVSDEEEFASGQEAAGDRVHRHQGVWWRELRYGFCQPSFAYRPLDHRTVWPQFLRSPAGYMHVAAAGSPANALFRVILRERMQEYSIQQLDRKRRNVVRAAVSRVAIRPVTRLEDLTGDGYEVYRSWRQRTGWGRERSDRAVYADWITRAFRRPRRIVLGAYHNNRLVAFMLPFALRYVASISYVASHTDALPFYPNDSLYHAFLCIARQTPGIELAGFGPVSSKASLDHFKLAYGEIKEMPAYCWVNPAVRLLVGRRMRQQYPWLISTVAPLLQKAS